jgi:hypothetical protein
VCNEEKMKVRQVLMVWTFKFTVKASTKSQLVRRNGAKLFSGLASLGLTDCQISRVFE